MVADIVLALVLFYWVLPWIGTALFCAIGRLIEWHFQA